MGEYPLKSRKMNALGGGKFPTQEHNRENKLAKPQINNHNPLPPCITESLFWLGFGLAANVYANINAVGCTGLILTFNYLSYMNGSGESKPLIFPFFVPCAHLSN